MTQINMEPILISILVLVIILSPFTWKFISKSFNFLKSIFQQKLHDEQKSSIIKEVVNSVDELIKCKKGGTIIFKSKEMFENYIVSAEEIDAKVKASLIITIFNNNYLPLHDGAIIIEGSRITYASVLISVMSKQKLPKKFGTRHRSAMGLAEVSDALILSISEERQIITLFRNSDYIKVDQKQLFSVLTSEWKT